MPVCSHFIYAGVFTFHLCRCVHISFMSMCSHFIYVGVFTFHLCRRVHISFMSVCSHFIYVGVFTFHLCRCVHISFMSVCSHLIYVGVFTFHLCICFFSRINIFSDQQYYLTYFVAARNAISRLSKGAVEFVSYTQATKRTVFRLIILTSNPVYQFSTNEYNATSVIINYLVKGELIQYIFLAHLSLFNICRFRQQKCKQKNYCSKDVIKVCVKK